MNFIKDWANICNTCTCGNRLKAERVLFWLVHSTTPFRFTDLLFHKSFLWFQHNSTKESYDTSCTV